jgi:hypothetical protein
MSTYFCHGNAFDGRGITVTYTDGGIVKTEVRNFSPYTGASVTTLPSEEYVKITEFRGPDVGAIPNSALIMPGDVLVCKQGEVPRHSAKFPNVESRTVGRAPNQKKVLNPGSMLSSKNGYERNNPPDDTLAPMTLRSVVARHGAKGPFATDTYEVWRKKQ